MRGDSEFLVPFEQCNLLAFTRTSESPEVNLRCSGRSQGSCCSTGVNGPPAEQDYQLNRMQNSKLGSRSVSINLRHFRAHYVVNMHLLFESCRANFGRSWHRIRLGHILHFSRSAVAEVGCTKLQRTSYWCDMAKPNLDHGWSRLLAS